MNDKVVMNKETCAQECSEWLDGIYLLAESIHGGELDKRTNGSDDSSHQSAYPPAQEGHEMSDGAGRDWSRAGGGSFAEVSSGSHVISRKGQAWVDVEGCQPCSDKKHENATDQHGPGIQISGSGRDRHLRQARTIPVAVGNLRDLAR